jgi:hypothetical protein
MTLRRVLDSQSGRQTRLPDAPLSTDHNVLSLPHRSSSWRVHRRAVHSSAAASLRMSNADCGRLFAIYGVEALRTMPQRCWQTNRRRASLQDSTTACSSIATAQKHGKQQTPATMGYNNRKALCNRPWTRQLRLRLAFFCYQSAYCNPSSTGSAHHYGSTCNFQITAFTLCYVFVRRERIQVLCDGRERLEHSEAPGLQDDRAQQSLHRLIDQADRRKINARGFIV